MCTTGLGSCNYQYTGHSQDSLRVACRVLSPASRRPNPNESDPHFPRDQTNRSEVCTERHTRTQHAADEPGAQKFEFNDRESRRKCARPKTPSHSHMRNGTWNSGYIRIYIYISGSIVSVRTWSNNRTEPQSVLKAEANPNKRHPTVRATQFDGFMESKRYDRILLYYIIKIFWYLF